MVVLLCGAALVLFASVWLTHGMGRLGQLLGLSEGLLGLTLAALSLLFCKSRLSRRGGAIITLYVVFVAVRLLRL